MRVVQLEENTATVELDTNELLALANALLVVLGRGPKEYGIPDWEFHTLMGVWQSEAERLGDEIRTLLFTKRRNDKEPN